MTSGPGAQWYRHGQIATVLAFLAFSVLTIALSASYFDHNDYLYASAAVRDGRLYQDLHYVQAPVGFWFWKLVAHAAPEGHIYLTMRAVSVGLTLVAVAVVAAGILTNVESRLLFLLAVAASYVPRAGAEIGTYSLALCFVAIGFAAFVRRGRGQRHLFAAGLLLGLAAGTKLNHVLLLAPPTLYFICEAISCRDFRRAGPPLTLLVAGALVGLLPVLYYAAQSWPAFVLHNLRFHSELANAAQGMTVFRSLQSLYVGLYELFLTHAVVLAASVWQAVRHPEPGVYFWLGSAAVAISMACAPMILHLQYLIPASLFLAIAFARAVPTFTAGVRDFVLWTTCPILAVIALNGFVTAVGRAEQHGFSLMKIDAAAAVLRDHAERFDESRAGCMRTLFTFSGAFAVDSGFELARYTEAGYFWAWTQGLVPDRYFDDPSHRFDPNLVHPSRWVRDETIDLLITGAYPDTERDLVAYADEGGFAAVKLAQLFDNEIVFRYRTECVRPSVPE